MPSRADRLRIERALRVVAFVALAAWIANALRPSFTRRDAARGTQLPAALERWTTTSGADSVHVALDTVPDRTSLAWLAAIRRAGVGLTWTGSGIPDLAVETYRAADPAGGMFV